MILGVDLGNWNIKTSEWNVFPSRYTTIENLLGATGDVLEYEGTKYYIREGKLENNYDKANKETNIILFLYALALQKERYFKVVVGLPALTYKTSRDTFKEKLLENKVYKLKINGIEKTIIIEDLIVFPEGAGAYYSLSQRTKNAVIVDIGGGTTNIVSFKNGKLDKCTTLGKGMIELYNNVREYLNSTYTLKLELEDIEVIMREGLRVDGNKISFAFIKPIIDSFVKDLMNELRNYPIRTSKVLLTGGGSKLLKGPLSKIPGLEVIDDYLFSNAKGFKKVGEAKWKE
ncbi:MAG: ParM/StbA family protein [Terrisporobacter othiniensis]|uniref:ParM/StbA family protein n=1 Tax=Terrisporobacter othiniensis TaxID=1577792 RepID=UPI002A756CE7|nr:ParM/StbA family protein [Terrisporobacter othiniensis]MDY3373330.1 ParM/StbA family protein [Terrisporobacter othiniensis]